MIALWIGIMLILLVPLNTPFNSYDEGAEVTHATRILQGDVPYRDLWTMYPPGQLYAIAALFKVFGTSLLVSRGYDTLVRLCIVVLVFLIARTIATRRSAASAALLAGLLLSSARFYSTPIFPAMALGLLAVFFTLQFIRTGQWKLLLLSGITIGIASVFRWDVGIYTLLSAIASVVGLHGTRDTHEPVTRHMRASALADLSTLTAATAFVVAAWVSAMGLSCGFGELWKQMVQFPLSGFHETRWKPYPGPFSPLVLMLNPNGIGLQMFASESIKWAVFYLPIVTFAAGIFHSLGLKREARVFLATPHIGMIPVVLFGMLLFVQSLNRFDYIHVIPSSIIAVLVGFLCVYRNDTLQQYRGSRVPNRTLLASIVVLYGIMSAGILVQTIGQYPPLRSASTNPIAAGVSLPSDQEFAVEFVRKRTSRGEAIFVCNRRHDKILFNDIGFYFLCDRPNASRYYELHPGVVTTLTVQQEIVRDILSHHVTWIVLVTTPESREPNSSARSSGIHYLDEFIRSAYTPVAEFGNYTILTRAIP